jgi:hypothetical protein
MVTKSITNIKEIFTDSMFESGCRLGKDGHHLFPIRRPDDRINPIIIRRLFATRGNKSLYWIDGWGLPSMDASEVEKEVIKDIIECLVWQNIK